MNLLKTLIVSIGIICIVSTATASQPNKKPPHDPKYYLSICAFFQDEAEYLKEWIEYHHLVGVQHFYLFNNKSKDNYLDVLKPYLESGIVELEDWPGTARKNWTPDQTKAYLHCLEQVNGITEWLAIIDIDEFIVPVKHDDIPAFLAQFNKKKNVGAIRINMQLYGTSHLPTLPKDKLMIESLVLKAPWDYFTPEENPDNTVVKCIVRPHAMKNYRIHEGDYLPGYQSVPRILASRPNLRFQPIKIDQIRLNHYWTRAEDFFYNVKVPRRLRTDEPNYLNIMNKKHIELNQVEDRIMDRFVPQLKERINCPVIL